MEACFKLKLLNGPLRDCELKLPPGQFVLGGNQADLELPLETIDHATLTISANEVVLSENVPCWTSGYRKKAIGALPLGVAIDLDGIHFVLGRTDETLPKLIVPARKTLWKTPLLLLFVSLLLAALLACYLLPPPVAITSSVKRFSQMLKAYPDIHTHWLNSDTLILSGTCHNSAQLNGLLTEIAATGIHLKQEVVCDDQLQASAQALLSSYGYPDATVTVDFPGHLLIDSNFHGNTAMLTTALNNLFGVKGWRLSDRSAEELKLLLAKFKAADLLNGLSICRDKDHWSLSGQFTLEQQTRLQKLINDINADPQTHLPLFYVGTTNSHDPDRYLPAAIASIGGNDQLLYLQLTNGMKLLPGALVKNGMRIVDINVQGVSLANEEALLFLPVQRQ